MMLYLSRSLSVGGALVVLLGVALGIGLGTQPARAQPPRPSPVPTSTSVSPTPKPGGDHPQATAVPTGRITGTVIDLTTGAPASGIMVVVGDVTVSTDANGNYDRAGLPSGSYPVALALADGQGSAAQEPVTVTLAADATVVQHLFFRSQPAATATPTTTATVVPAALPRTGASEPSAWLWVVLGAGMIILGGMVRLARQGAKSVKR
jgi:hypothetical protein